MDFEGIKDIIKAMDNSSLDYLEVNWQGISFVMKKTGEPAVEAVKKEVVKDPVVTEKVEIVQEKTVEAVVSKEPVVAVEDLHVVASPIVGTFYGAPGPGKDDFVKVGSTVKKGDTLCILEAMKLMNEIQSDVNGEVVEILVSNEQMVEYNQPLFKIRKK
ncbi:MAG: acetyl-CoA carboxylase biotin carboxyl carrier protein [Solirubrobacterales bacterium]